MDSIDVNLSYYSNNKYYDIQLGKTKIEKCDEDEIMPHKFRYECIDQLKKITDSFKNNRAGGVEQSLNSTQEFYDSWKKFDL